LITSRAALVTYPRISICGSMSSGSQGRSASRYHGTLELEHSTLVDAPDGRGLANAIATLERLAGRA
jgi:hypothetical protein